MPALGFKPRRVLAVKKLVTLVAKLFEPRGNGGIDFREILLEIFDVRFQIGFFLVRADQSKRALPGRQDVGAAIFIFLQNFHDHRGTARLRELFFVDVYDSEWGLRVDAVARHLPVARLENMQRHSLAGEEDDV